MAGTGDSAFLNSADAKVNPDLVSERKKSTFNHKEMTCTLYSNKMVQKLRFLRKKLEENSHIWDSRYLWHIARPERYIRVCQKAEEFVRILRTFNLMRDEESVGALEIMSGDDFFILLHLTMFIPSLTSLADDEQLSWWLEAARDFRILGTYAQTELSHGSNVAALQTTAELDLNTDEWVINTPNDNACKWWPGGLAKSSTHCTLMARVMIEKKDFGVRAFMLPIRGIDTHKTKTGIELFDIGQKLGYNGMDNGGMRLTNVRIPRRYLLGRYCKVDKNGEFREVGDQRMLYATMTYTRKQIIMAAGPSLARCAVIATRYSAVRRQFSGGKVSTTKPPTESADARNNNAEPQELQVLDYSTQQYTLFPIMATAVAFNATSPFLEEMYSEMMTRAQNGDYSLLAEVHSATSAMKATMTLVASDCMEICRKSLGGHGYLLSSGIPLHLTSYVAQATYEGDFSILSIQAGRALLKLVQKKMKSVDKSVLAPPCSHRMRTYDYILDSDPFAETDPPSDPLPTGDPKWHLNAFQKRSAHLVFSTAQKFFEATTARGLTQLEALEELKIELARITKAHTHVIVLNCFQQFVEDSKNREKRSAQVIAVLRQLCDLYALYWMENSFGEFVAAGVLSPHHQDALLSAIKDLLRAFRPNAVAFADAWDFPDHFLNSALGRYDGRVYEALIDAAQKEPLNESDVAEGYYRHIQFILHPDRQRNISSRL